MENMEFLKAMLAEMNANMKTNQEIMKEIKDEIKEDMNANRKAGRVYLKETMEEVMNANQAKMDANLKEMRGEVKSGQAEMRSIVNAWISNMGDDQKETVSYQVTMEACQDSKELNPEDMKSEVEHWEVPTEEATVKSSGTTKKRHGLTSSCRVMQRAKGTDPRRLWILEEVGCRLQEGVPLCSRVQEKRLQENCGPRKELAAAGRRMTHCAKLAQCKEHRHERPSGRTGTVKELDRNKFARGTRKGWTLGRRQLVLQEGISGTKNRDFEEHPRLGSERTTSEFDRKAFRH
jgi:hypothetical protein